MSVDTVLNLDDLPPGAYQITGVDPAIIDDWAASLTGTGTGCQGEAVTSHKAFLWGPDSTYYYWLDNIYDEIAVGLRHSGEDGSQLDDHVLQLMNKVGLSSLRTLANRISPIDLSGGQQQRLLVAVLLSRGIRHVVAVDPLIYVEQRDRQGLYRLVADMAERSGGCLLIWSTDEQLPRDALKGYLTVDSTGCRVMPLSKVALNTGESSPLPSSAGFHGFRSSGNCKTVLAVRGATWVFPNGRTGVQVSSLELQAGRIYVVCGPNGGGKSSLVRLLTSNRRLPNGSSIDFCGRRVDNPYRRLVRTRQLTFTLQDPNVHITGGTLAEFARSSGVPCEIIDCLRISHYLDEDMLSAPFWVRQAAVFASAVCSESRLVILDEPLDGTAYKVFGKAAVQILRDATSTGSSALLVTHNPQLALAAADEFVWVANGAVLSTVSRQQLTATGHLHDWLHGGQCQD